MLNRFLKNQYLYFLQINGKRTCFRLGSVIGVAVRVGRNTPDLYLQRFHDGGPGLKIRIGVESKFRSDLNCRTYTVP